MMNLGGDHLPHAVAPLDLVRAVLSPPDETAFVYTFGGRIRAPDERLNEGISARVYCDPGARDWWSDYSRRPTDRAVDPIRRAIRHGVAPVRWKYFEGRTDMSETERAMWRRTREMGLYDGLCAPIHDAASMSYGALSALHFGNAGDFTDWLHERGFALGSVAYLAHQAIAGSVAAFDPPITLSRRERECLALVADGLCSKAIARRLELSPRTVELHVARATKRLGAANRCQAVSIAIRIGALNWPVQG